jgi:hypothetical protein
MTGVAASPPGVPDRLCKTTVAAWRDQKMEETVEWAGPFRFPVRPGLGLLVPRV